MKRVFDPNQPELMDRPQPVTAELEANLRNLVSLNRWFGSHRLVRKFLANWLNAEREFRILDLATGAGDLPRVVAAWARSHGVVVKIDAVDANEATLEIAARSSREFPEITFLRDNALTFSPAGTYDLVCCSLALHHFSEGDAVRLLRHCRRLSHRFVLVSDLERGHATLLAVRVITALLYREPMTRADAIMSAHRAFSFSEFRALAESAGWTDFCHSRFLFCRQAVWMDADSVGDIPIADALPCPT